MKNVIFVTSVVLLISCGQQEKSITNGEIVDSLQTKATLAISAADTFLDSSKLIIPGKSIGHVHLNEQGDSIFSKLGRPDGDDAAMGKSVSIYKSKENGSSFKIYYVANRGESNETPRAKLFYTTSSFFATENKISVGSKLEEIKKYFPNLKHLAVITIDKDSLQLYDAAMEGIAFELDKAQICRGITLHAAGEELQPTFLPFYKSVKIIKN